MLATLRYPSIGYAGADRIYFCCLLVTCLEHACSSSCLAVSNGRYLRFAVLNRRRSTAIRAISNAGSRDGPTIDPTPLHRIENSVVTAGASAHAPLLGGATTS